MQRAIGRINQAKSKNAAHAGSSDLSAEIQAADYEAFKRVRVAYCIGLYAAGPSVFISVQPFTEARPVLIWWLVQYALHTLSVFVAYAPVTNRNLTSLGLPRGFMLTSVVSLFHIGALDFFSPTSTSSVSDLTFVGLGLTFGTAAALLAAFGTNATFTRVILVAHFTPLMVLFALQETFSRGLGYLTFLALVLLAVGRQRAGLLKTIELQAAIQTEADQAEWMASHDSLTKLLNRFGLANAAASGEIDQFEGALFVDLDSFKQVNDRLGHQAGDELLRQVAVRLQHIVRDRGVVARLGGDEFLVLIEESEETLHGLGVLVVGRLSEPFDLNDATAHISASVGIAVNDGSKSLQELLRESDLAVYKAKTSGRAHVVSYDASVDEEVAKRAKLAEEFRRLIQVNQLSFHGQPIYDAKTGDVVIVELLARWPLPDGSFVPPDVFLSIAEQQGLMGEVTIAALEQAFACREAWKEDQVLAGAKIAINVSPTCLTTRFVSGRLMPMLKRSGIDNSKLVLEITEHSAIENREQVIDVLTQLGGEGLTFALDDFGTGYSSLSELLNFPLGTIKIDRSLVYGSEGTDDHLHVLVAITELASRLGRDVVAEGIETEEQLRALREVGIDFVQGYLLCRPLPLDDLPDRAVGHFGRPRPGEPTLASAKKVPL